MLATPASPLTISTPMPEPTKPQRGGTRPGAGRKPAVTGDDVRPVTLRMSAADEATLREAGDGILSRGVQIAAQLVRDRGGR